MQAFDKMWETPRSALAVSVTSKQKALAGPAAKFPVNSSLSTLSAFCVCFLVGSEARLCHLLRNSANRPVLLERSWLASLTCRPVPANACLSWDRKGPQGGGGSGYRQVRSLTPFRLSGMGKEGYQFHRIFSPFLGSQKLEGQHRHGERKSKRREATNPQGSLPETRRRGSDLASSWLWGLRPTLDLSEPCPPSGSGGGRASLVIADY